MQSIDPVQPLYPSVYAGEKASVWVIFRISRAKSAVRNWRAATSTANSCRFSRPQEDIFIRSNVLRPEGCSQLCVSESTNIAAVRRQCLVRGTLQSVPDNWTKSDLRSRYPSGYQLGECTFDDHQDECQVRVLRHMLIDEPNDMMWIATVISASDAVRV